jgi:hypothetical protein
MSTIDLKKSRAYVEEILRNKITGEYSWLDFKLEYEGNPEKLIHDILCLSNARHAGDRYLIYGIEYGTWALKGLSENLKSSDIYSIVNIQIWDHKPVIAVDHVRLHDKIFGFIVIADTPAKPHYLRKPYKGIPAGAVYIRQGAQTLHSEPLMRLGLLRTESLKLCFARGLVSINHYSKSSKFYCGKVQNGKNSKREKRGDFFIRTFQNIKYGSVSRR